MEKALATTHNAPVTTDAEKFIMAAIEKNVPVETMERLLAMRDKLRAEAARADYDFAMARFQAECPIIHKGKSVMNKGGVSVRYSYATLDSIVSQTRDLIAKHGFRYMVNVEMDGSFITTTVSIMHTGGHSESSSFKVPIDKDAFMNEQQKVAAAMTYAKRYALCNAFGILTGDEDDDSNSTTKTPDAPRPQNSEPAEAAGLSGEPSAEDVTNVFEGTVEKPAPVVDGDIVMGYQDEQVKDLPTKNEGKFRYKITIGSKPYYTFDKNIAATARMAFEDGKSIRLKFKSTKFGNDIVMLTSGGAAE